MDEGSRFETLAIHAGQSPEAVTGAVMTPIFLTSTYAQDGPGGHRGFEYSRTQNPTRFALEANLAALEGGQWGLCFASGLAASSAVLSLLSAGDQVAAGDDLYGGSYRLFERVFRRLGIDFVYFDARDPTALERTLTPRTRLCWLETPTNPLLRLADIAAASAVCRRAGVPLAVDNTFMSPFFQRPLALGADLVVHSTTKYLNGHSDVVGGAVVGRAPELKERLSFVQNAMGGSQSALDSFLVLRGTKTLHVRMARHQENALAVARFLEARADVAAVIYPGLPSHPQHELARRQMSGFGGMVSFVLRDGGRDGAGGSGGSDSGEGASSGGGASTLERARAFLRALRVFTCAESLGGVESLAEHPAIMTHASLPPERRAALGIGDGLIRLSVGIENIADLLADLERGLAAAAAAGDPAASGPAARDPAAPAG